MMGDCRYTKPVSFTATGRYGCGPPEEDDVYTVDEFRRNVSCGAFVDYDGFGYPVKNSMANPTIVIQPSRLDRIPPDATHIVWFNR